MKTYSRVYAEINLDAILHNMEQMRKLLKEDTKIMGVIKTDGYGHGAVPIGKELEKLEYTWGYATATVEEAEILRRNGLKKPILVLGATFPEQYEAMADLELRVNVYSIGQAERMEEAAAKMKKKIIVHAKIDTGLSRLGFQVTEQAADEIARISKMPHIIMEGIFTHFAKSDEKENINLAPVMSLKSCIVFLKELEKGRVISYGATYETSKKQRIATIPVGYGDGYPRSLSNKGYVLIHGKKAPICGRICMDQFMVDVTDIPEAREGDMVTLVGKDHGAEITMEEIGDLSGRFNYEFACDLGKRIPRVYVKNGEVVETRDYFGE